MLPRGCFFGVAMADFSIMTWNVENLFLPDLGAEPALRDRFDRKLTLLAAAIADPDERGIRCAIVSSLPIDSQRQVQVFSGSDQTGPDP